MNSAYQLFIIYTFLSNNNVTQVGWLLDRTGFSFHFIIDGYWHRLILFSCCSLSTVSKVDITDSGYWVTVSTEQFDEVYPELRILIPPCFFLQTNSVVITISCIQTPCYDPMLKCPSKTLEQIPTSQSVSILVSGNGNMVPWRRPPFLCLWACIHDPPEQVFINVDRFCKWCKK